MQETFQKQKTSFDLSLKSTVGIAAAIRVAAKRRKIVDLDFNMKLINYNQDVNTFFSVEKVNFIKFTADFETEAIETLVFCNNLKEFINNIVKGRDMPNFHPKILYRFRRRDFESLSFHPNFGGD